MSRSTYIALAVVTMAWGSSSTVAQPPPQKYYLYFTKADCRSHLSALAWAAPEPGRVVSDEMTIEVWIKWGGPALTEVDPEGVPFKSQTLMCGQGAFGFGYDDNSGAWSFLLETDEQLRDGGLEQYPPIGEWAHLAATYDGAFIRSYLNGVLDDEVPFSGTIVIGPDTQLTQQEHCCNGCDRDPRSPEGAFELGMGWGFEGGVRDVRLWNRALSQGELVANASVRLTGLEPGLVAYWPLDDGGEGPEARNLVPAGLPLGFDVPRPKTRPNWHLTDPFFRVREDLVEDIWDESDLSVDGFTQALIDHRGQDGDLSVVLNGFAGCCARDETPFRALAQQPTGELSQDTDAVLTGVLPTGGGSETVVDLNADDFDDFVVGAVGEDFCPDSGAQNTLALSDPTGHLWGSNDQAVGFPCTSQSPMFAGQHLCHKGDAAGGGGMTDRYPDITAPLEPVGLADSTGTIASGDIDGDLHVDLWVNNGGTKTSYFLSR